MPVIINELEVITNAPPETALAPVGEASQVAAQPAATPALSPEDIEAITRHQAERASRLYAG